jgi:DNA-binding MurR/RpiR family transcriptional regulator
MSICDSIKKRYIRLSKGQRKVAKFVIDNPTVITTQVASEIGRQAGVSESTVIRFCYAMDLSGFIELQQKIKEHLIENNGAAPAALKKRAYKKQNIPCNEVMSKDVDGIINIMQKISEADFNKTINILHNADRIFVLGVRESAPAALFLYNSLASYRSEVYLMNYKSEKMAIDLTQMNEKSVLFVVEVDEDQEDVTAVVELTKRKNSKVIAVTEDAPCLLQEQADILFPMGKPSQKIIPCEMAVFSLLHAVVECMVMQHKEYYQNAGTKKSKNIRESLMELV